MFVTTVKFSICRYPVMAASAEVLPVENSEAPGGEWTVVFPRRGKRKTLPRLLTPEQQQEESWTPVDTEANPERESKLMAELDACMKILERSEFYCTFRDQVNSELHGCISVALGAESKMQMVVYGIGSIESYESPRWQLSLALLMKRNFDWIGEVDVFDPILSATESKVLNSFGCSVLSVNEQGRRQASKPTLFFMPHCEAQLYRNLLLANWNAEKLNRMVLFGNSFRKYEEQFSFFTNSNLVTSAAHILAIQKYTDEFEVKNMTGNYFAAFHNSNWHFFGLNPEVKLPSIGI